MKKFFCMLLACCMLATLTSVPAYATEVDDVTIIELSDTLTVEIRLETYQTYRASSKIGTKSYIVKDSGREVASTTLLAYFEYNGSTAWVTDTDYTYSTVNGCTYSHGGITTSGNRASMSGTFYYGGTNYPFSISLTCSGSGTIS